MSKDRSLDKHRADLRLVDEESEQAAQMAAEWGPDESAPEDAKR